MVETIYGLVSFEHWLQLRVSEQLVDLFWTIRLLQLQGLIMMPEITLTSG